MIPGGSGAHIVTIEGSADELKNTIDAAALCACGVPIRTHKTPRERTGEVEWRFDYDPARIVPARGSAAAAVVIHQMSYSCASLTANQLMHAYRAGDLDREDPTHPFLDAVRALRNRERFLRWIINGQACQLVKHPACDRWQYESAPRIDLPAHMLAEIHPTREMKTVCALGVFGVPNARISGIFPDNTFDVAGIGFAGDVAPPQSPQLARDFLDGSLDAREPDHPYFIAYSALETMQNLKRHMKYEIANIWLEKPKSKARRAAVIRADATSKARDIVFHHFRRGE